MNLNIYKVAFLLYQLFIFWNLFVVYFLDRGCRKKVSTCRWLVTIFYFTCIGNFTWIGNEQLFKVDLSHLITFFLQSSKVGSPSTLMRTINTVLSTADKIFKSSYGTDSYGKNSTNLGAINSWNKTQHHFSNVSLKTFSPTKIKSALFKKCIGKY